MNRLTYVSCLGVLTVGLRSWAIASEQEIDASLLTNQGPHIQAMHFDPEIAEDILQGGRWTLWPYAQELLKAARKNNQEARSKVIRGIFYRKIPLEKLRLVGVMDWVQQAGETFGIQGAFVRLFYLQERKKANKEEIREFLESFSVKKDAPFALHYHYAALSCDIQDRRGILELTELAIQGYAAAQCNLGLMYDEGQGVAQDDTKAFKWYKKAANQGYIAAQHNLGLMYDEGQGVAQDDIKAFKWYKKAAKQGYIAAQYNLGLMYDKGQGVAQDDTKAFKWYKKAANQGDAQAQYNVGVMYTEGQGVEQDDTKAFKWYKKAANQGDAQAQYRLGMMYTEGQVVGQDDTKAFKWYQKAAAQNYAKAQYNLGVMYTEGRGIEQDHQKAFEWYQKAAAQSYEEAQYKLGFMYEIGQGVEQNDEKAVEWYQKAKNQSAADVQFNLWLRYEKGQGVEQNDEKAMKWLQKAAIQGHLDAQYNLGLKYETGQGVGQDLSQALEWFLKVAKQGIPRILVTHTISDSKGITRIITSQRIDKIFKELLDLPLPGQAFKTKTMPLPSQGLFGRGVLGIRSQGLSLLKFLGLSSQEGSCESKIISPQDLFKKVLQEQDRTLFLQARSSFKGNQDFSQNYEKVSAWYQIVNQGIERLFSTPQEGHPTLFKVNSKIQDKLLQKGFPQVDRADLSLSHKQERTPFITFYKWEQEGTQHVFVSFEREAVEFSTTFLTALAALEKYWLHQKAICETAGPGYFYSLTRRALDDEPSPKVRVSEENQDLLFYEFGKPGFKEGLKNKLQGIPLESDSLIQEYLKEPETFQARLTPEVVAFQEILKVFQARDQILIENSLQLVTDVKKTLLNLLLDRHEINKEKFNKTYPYLEGLLD